MQCVTSLTTDVCIYIQMGNAFGGARASVPVATVVELLPSCFVGRPCTIFFDLPPGVAPREMSTSCRLPGGGRIRVRLDELAKHTLCTRIDPNSDGRGLHCSKVVLHALKRAGFSVNPADAEASAAATTVGTDLPAGGAAASAAPSAACPSSAICISRHYGDVLAEHVPVGAVLNHFPGSMVLARKDDLADMLAAQVRLTLALCHAHVRMCT